MRHQFRSGLFVVMATLTVLTTPPAFAQVDSTLYLTVDCMKSTSPDYVDVEQQIWKPMHQELVNQGRKATWALYGVRFGSREKCDYYTVSTFFGSKSMQSDLADLPDVFAKVHSEADLDEAVAKTLASREVVETELWMMVAGVRPQAFNFIYVNKMHAQDGPAYVDFESDVFEPVHQALVDDGFTKGWYLHALLSPHGSEIGYNFATVDFVDDLGPIPIGEYLAKVHPDRSMEETVLQTGAARELVSSQTWSLIAQTEPKTVMNDQ
ncbi:MAG TPA: hypothetical protein VGA18_01385 [Rhodothermales bacterium]